MEGTVVSYNDLTGSLTFQITLAIGTGTYAVWTVNLQAATGAAGTSGVNGTSGTSGTSGISGVGTDGTSGTSGQTALAFPYTGSAQITGSLGVTGSAKFNGTADFTGGDFKVTDQNRNGEFDVDYFKVKTQKGAQFTGSLSVSAGFTASLQSGYAWVGGAGNVSTAVATASFGAGVGFPFVGKAEITGSINVSGSYLITSQSFTGSLVDNVSPTFGGVPVVKHVIAITSASYAALATKDPNTLYVVSGSAITGSGGGISSVTIADEGTAQGAATFLNFIGAGVTATVTSNTASITISGGGSGFPVTGSAIISGSLIVTGSALGNVVSASITSNTASIDFNTGNFYTSLVTGTTFFNITGVNPGESCNLLLTTVGKATASFSSNVKQVSGSRYVPSSGSNNTDLLSFAAFNSTAIYLVASKKFI
jgi:hypothetical protein